MTHYWKKKKVIVTGAGGFIGSHFCDELRKLGADVLAISNGSKKNIVQSSKINLLNYSKVEEIFNSNKIEVVIHCAALDGNQEFKRLNSARIFDENIRMVSNILNAASNNSVKDIVIMSSSEIYSPDMASPISEKDDYSKCFHYSGNGYILSKIFSEILANQFANQFKLNVFLPRPTNVYGPGDKFDSSTNRVIPSMIRKVLNGEEIEIWGNGNQIRGFIYINDLVTAILSMVELRRYGAANIASPESISIKALAKLISNLTKTKSKIHLMKDMPTGVNKRILNTQKLNEAFNFEYTTLTDGIFDTINWYKKNMPDQ